MPDTRTIAIDVGGTFTDITFADAGTGATWVANTPLFVHAAGTSSALIGRRRLRRW